ncbi:ATP-binding protein [Streptomyces avicenniae]|uniref:ATP-binding protein n=1 Tax=Streptomyces avicenniae TaxID=500153 RepID=UPI00069B0D6E|nr:ATP-binding protein [Streptomyces avicenniae]
MTVPVRFAERQHYAYAWDLLADARGIETWRWTLVLVLRSWGASEAAVEVARMGLSEVLTNVVRHVDDPHCRLSAVLDGGRVTVRVEDRSPCLPVVTEPDWDAESEPDWDAESGRGLWMLRSMCRDFGCDPEVGGKCVWFTLDLTPDPAPNLASDPGDADDEAVA